MPAEAPITVIFIILRPQLCYSNLIDFVEGKLLTF